ncbi:MAG TPA: PAS domain S-box protein, partial [Allocoleopsis sp.]
MPEKPRHRSSGRANLTALLVALILPFVLVLYQLLAEIKQHEDYWVEAFTLLILTAVGYVLVAFNHNLVAQKRSEQRLNAHYLATRALAESTTLHQGIPKVLQAICEHLEWDLGEVWQVDSAAQILQLVDLGGKASIDLTPFQAIAQDFTIAPGVGLPGQVWQQAQSIWIPDLTRDSHLVRSALIEQGMQAACGFPIRSCDQVVGVMLFFSRTRHPQDADVLRLMESIASQVGQFMQRCQTETALRRSEELQRLALSAAHMGVWDFNILTGEEQWSEEAHRIFGLPPETFNHTYEDFLRCVHPDDRAQVIEAQERAIREGIDYAPDHRIVHPDGSVHWISSRGRVLRDEAGNPVRLSGISMDITERKQAELVLAQSAKRLRQAEEKYRSIFENAVTGIFQSSPEGYYLSANPAMARILGYASAKELITEMTDIARQLYVDVDRRRVLVEQMTQFGSVSEFESQVYRRDGSIIWISASAIAIRDEEDNLLYYEGTVEDITHRKQAEAELERQLAAIEATIHGIAILDNEGRFIYMNSAHAAIYGYNNAAELIGQPWQVLYDSAELQRFEQEIMPRFFQEGFWRGEAIGKRRDGTAYQQEVSLTLVQDGGLVCVVQDITDRKRQEERLRLLESVVVHTGDSVIITEAEPIHPPGPRILYVNPAFTAKTGYTLEEVMGKTPRLLQGEGSDRATLQKIREALQVWQPISVEVLNYRKDGTAFWSDLTMTPVADETGGYTHWIAIQRDITERKQAEADLRRSKEAAEEASRAKSQFLANMSHELRTPLNAIIGYSEMLQEDADDFGYADIVPDLEKIRGAGKHLLSLINDILDISKIEAGKMELYLETFEVAQLVREVESTIQPLMEKNHNKLQIHCPDNIGSMHADLTKLRQSLLNLISNAAKFTENGTITLTIDRDSDWEGGSDLKLAPEEKSAPGEKITPEENLTPEETDPLFPAGSSPFIRFQVTDTGIGMTLDQVSKVFQAFIQADASTTRKYGGTGLGLAITRHFCHMMGGDISVRSQLGQGSTFTIRLPIEIPAVPDDLPDEMPAANVAAIAPLTGSNP